MHPAILIFADVVVGGFVELVFVGDDVGRVIAPAVVDDGFSSSLELVKRGIHYGVVFLGDVEFDLNIPDNRYTL
jgi:hypothetical protein